MRRVLVVLSALCLVAALGVAWYLAWGTGRGDGDRPGWRRTQPVTIYVTPPALDQRPDPGEPPAKIDLDVEEGKLRIPIAIVWGKPTGTGEVQVTWGE